MGEAWETSSVTVMFWNLENFFDFKDDGTGESDTEFSAEGARRWTRSRFYRKCHAVAKTILWSGGVKEDLGGKGNGEDGSGMKMDGEERLGRKGNIEEGLGWKGGGEEGLGWKGDGEEETGWERGGEGKYGGEGNGETGVGVGRLPDIVGMAEVENRFVLTQLVSKTALRKLDYKIVHFESPDPRGIDCALLYRASRLTLVSAKPCLVSAPGLQTRDILLAQFVTLSGDSLAVLVNHHPSKYGGGGTDWRREVAVARLRALGDSLAAAGWDKAVAVGDFNDVPDNPLFARLAPAFTLCRQSAQTHGGAQAYGVAQAYGGGSGASRQGSIRFNGEWQLIDLCFVSPALRESASFRVLEPPFLMERDAAHSGDRPMRTYSGPRYLGGVSDHRPIFARIYIRPEKQ